MLSSAFTNILLCRYSPAIKTQTCKAPFISAQDNRVVFLKSFNKLAVGMAVGVVSSAAYQRNLWPCQLKKLLISRVPGPVMCDL